MNKEEIIEAMAKAAEISKTQADKALDALLDSVKATLKKGLTVTFTGFGTFKTSKRSARVGINPKTREKINIPAAVVPKFSAGKGLKEAVR